VLLPIAEGELEGPEGTLLDFWRDMLGVMEDGA